MKRLVFALLLVPFLLHAQNKLQVDDNRNIYMEKVIKAPQYSKEELYDIALNWVSTAFNSPKDVISFSNKELGKIKGQFYHEYIVLISGLPFMNTFEILVKNGKTKIKIFDIYEAEINFKLRHYILKRNNTFKSNAGMKDNVESTLNNLINSYQSYISNYSNIDDDW